MRILQLPEIRRVLEYPAIIERIRAAPTIHSRGAEMARSHV